MPAKVTGGTVGKEPGSCFGANCEEDVFSLDMCEKHYRRYKEAVNREYADSAHRCAVCEVEMNFKRRDAKYCSKHCANSAARVRSGKPPLMTVRPLTPEERILAEVRRYMREHGMKRECKECGKELPSRAVYKHYCSDKCQDKRENRILDEHGLDGLLENFDAEIDEELVDEMADMI